MQIKKNIPYVIIVGDEELKQMKVTLKDMETGEQQKIEMTKIKENIRKGDYNGKN